MSDSEDYSDEELEAMQQHGEDDSDSGGASGSEGGDEDGSDGEGGPSGAGAHGPGAPAKRKPIYNVDGLHEKLEDIAWGEDAPWEEAQAVTAKEATQVDNIDDDLGRELAFYNQAMGAAAEAIRRFEAAGVAWHRPADYYAEMVKSDEHMAKVKDRLMHEQQQIEEADERRKAREQKAYSKQVQAQKTRERAAEKKRQIEAVSQLRKQRQKSRGAQWEGAGLRPGRGEAWSA
ncbi:hypothetical protein MNEG_11189 [Monoraphidium neglectum]|uniref:rRNA-processing protein EBP2 n=1 Tax=Monoraphidium neglectum TaxID=145388 RepID=A0A0D2LZG0_9CHLO|nr:hypothetical protein MNEG_11189 [Monoraphidium neglectum]KIY96774.1 hypothetical protein MNEG_11189 [Monoraphidium neglectum]|eukprot:XP_013895794.1 hypothetical protein MNEG_11189 [Monoraphidium neglectum]